MAEGGHSINGCGKRDDAAGLAGKMPRGIQARREGSGVKLSNSPRPARPVAFPTVADASRSKLPAAAGTDRRG